MKKTKRLHQKLNRFQDIRVVFLAEKTCPDPGKPERGYRLGHVTVGSTMRFSCQSGFKLHGSKERICLGNKEWSGSLTTCQNGSMYSSFTVVIISVSNSRYGIICCQNSIAVVRLFFLFLKLILHIVQTFVILGLKVYGCSIFKVLPKVIKDRHFRRILSLLLHLSLRYIASHACANVLKRATSKTRTSV